MYGNVVNAEREKAQKLDNALMTKVQAADASEQQLQIFASIARRFDAGQLGPDSDVVYEASAALNRAASLMDFDPLIPIEKMRDIEEFKKAMSKGGVMATAANLLEMGNYYRDLSYYHQRWLAATNGNSDYGFCPWARQTLPPELYNYRAGVRLMTPEYITATQNYIADPSKRINTATGKPFTEDEVRSRLDKKYMSGLYDAIAHGRYSFPSSAPQQ
jgi:hypothetical protein